MERGEGLGMRWRRVLGWILVVFALYAVYRSPESAAGFVRGVGEALGTLVNSVGAFFDGLLA
ncbi:hypothetical protein [Kineococcus indalonis]|uniref:hypothetical protein n=1 Tax=Kineococcus indalonis TaxID=2696566 RepID=UPI001412ACD3|nr:hypothetical protein [Kineococcus indalonis]NAZ88791.1 hypothetical protein [Kineococcus indalonis]